MADRHRRFLILACIVLLTACHSERKQSPSSGKNSGVYKNASGQTVIDMPKPQAEREGDATAGIDPDMPLQTSITPKPEPILPSTTKPYVFNGETIRPMPRLQPYTETGLASWYGLKFHGKKTASGEPYDLYKLSAAHRTLPIPCYLRVTNLSNQKSVIVRVNDRGPFSSKRIVDLSYAAAKQLDLIRGGSSQVKISVILPGEENTDTVATDAGQTTPPVTAELAHGWYVQTGAFAQEENANRMLQRIMAAWPETQTMTNKVYNGEVYQLLLGPYATRSQAAQAAEHCREILQLRPIILSK